MMGKGHLAICAVGFVAPSPVACSMGLGGFARSTPAQKAL
eukprot:CAMPEP_0182936138 /NCGR_PEP_ID=MMETSP0105_2-20130417/39664_1 /TAXON_ID=81532 ORGANISM="Acanthoeca-like sp., Strain 10tr" /NCGR_SAMPLE_ID=MMETSP0105_2 /ASSEMBLY_ACC=CAM_ASM_000205 /LENGTH=39 /DNA_ID= /DNA_START= /DNA_END= /DNA_ORIENTATION=